MANHLIMDKILIALAGFAALVTAPSAASARDPLAGRWDNGKMSIRIAPCGPSLCGTVIRASAKQQAKAERGSGTDLIGATLIRDIRETGPGTYQARVFLADRNVYAKGTIRVHGRDQLKVRGCVLGVICKAQTWDRAR